MLLNNDGGLAFNRVQISIGNLSYISFWYLNTSHFRWEHCHQLAFVDRRGSTHRPYLGAELEPQYAAKEATHLTASICGVPDLKATRSILFQAYKAIDHIGIDLSRKQNETEKWVDEDRCFTTEQRKMKRQDHV